MPTITILTNASQGTDVLIRDLGIVIPASGGSETFTDRNNIIKCSSSRNLLTLATDDAHGAGSSTLILNDGGGNIAQADAAEFLDAMPAEYVASNIGTAGVGVFAQKNIGTFEFKNVNIGSSQMTISDDTGNDEIDLDVDGGQITDVGAFSSAASAVSGGVITTTSNTDVLMTGMTTTPGAGTYYVIVSGSGFMNSNNKSFFVTIYFNGVADATSIRESEALDALPFLSVGVGTVAAGQTIEARWRVDNGTGSVLQNRSLVCVKLTS